MKGNKAFSAFDCNSDKKQEGLIHSFFSIGLYFNPEHEDYMFLKRQLTFTGPHVVIATATRASNPMSDGLFLKSHIQKYL
jgi:hypothetical protein